LVQRFSQDLQYANDKNNDSLAQRALAIDPQGADAFLYLQWVYEQSGQFEKAIETVARRSNTTRI